ncbi:TetR/AcrR family transcriptional regulator [Actinomadura physcomitrii]|uniref:TetR/AcrR family transcriptional regulator n=1 Tax=Actinomadura physcomitrii TaxID=2650748 RepID=UPI001368BB22|nr:TetR/AcrR family transcriptional regulator [Actinomadura physcomitrii]
MNQPTRESAGRPDDTSAKPARKPRNRSWRQVEESAEIKAGIVRAATEVFAERGYQQTTLSEIARLRGLSRSGVLHHFASKEALFQAVLDELQTEAGRRFAPVNEAGPLLDHIRDLAVFLGTSEEVRLSLRLVHVLEGEGIAGNEAARAFAERRAQGIREMIISLLESARRGGEIAADTDLDAAAALISGTINGLQKLSLIDASLDVGASFELFADMLAARLAARRG